MKKRLFTLLACAAGFFGLLVTLALLNVEQVFSLLFASIYALACLIALFLLRRRRKAGLPPTKAGKILRSAGLTLSWLSGLWGVFLLLGDAGVLDERGALLFALACAALGLSILLLRWRKKRPAPVFTPSAPKKRPPRLLLLPLALLAACVACFCLLRPAPIPDSLTAFKAKYPEAAAFVDNYPRLHNAQSSMDVSAEVHKGTVPLFLQWDERWGYKDYGGDFFATNGCGPTCLSMVVCGLTGNAKANPYEVSLYAESMGWYTPGSGTSWSLMEEGAQHYGLQSEQGDVSASYITGQLEAGCVLVASMKPGDFTYTGHYIVLTGLDAEGKAIVNDPNSRVNSRKAWSVKTLVEQMKAVWSYSLSE